METAGVDFHSQRQRLIETTDRLLNHDKE